MPYNGAGLFSVYTPGTPYVTGTIISSTVANNVNNDFATGLSTAITKNGQTTITANLPMGGFKLTGLTVGSSAADSARLDQLQNVTSNWVVAGGTADAITATYSPALSALVDGQLCYFRATAANATTTPTFSPNGLTARTITLEGGSALRANEIPAANAEVILRYNLANTRWELMNPAFARTGANTDITSTSALTAMTNLATINGSPAVWNNSVNDFRLTLTTGVPVTTSDVTGATTIYLTPYKGNRISLFTSGVWKTYITTELSVALGTLTSGLPYDVFVFDNSGNPTLNIVAWTNSTTRATALVYQDGVLVKSGGAAFRYLGTFYTTSTTQTEDSAAKRFLWNYYNRVFRNWIKTSGTASWTYTIATFRQANADATLQLDCVVGVSEDSTEITAYCPASNAGGILVSTGVGVNSTTVNSAQTGGSAAGGNAVGIASTYSAVLPLGRNFFPWLEWSTASGTTTWSALSANNLGSIRGRLMA